MKKLLTFFAIGLLVSCSTDDEMSQLENQNLVATDATTCEAFTAGNDSSLEIELEEAKALPSFDEVRKLYVTMLDSGVPTNGTYSPTIKQIVTQFNTGEMIGEYPTTYTVKNSDGCTDSTILTLKVVEEISDEPVCEISAGEDARFEIELSEAEAIPSEDELRKLYLNNLGEGISTRGTFSPSMSQIVIEFNSGEKLGEYSTTYTVKSENCTDSAVLTLVVIEDEVVCDLNAGNDKSFEIELSVAESIPSLDELRKIYERNLDRGVSTTGTYSPTMSQIVAQFNSGEKLGEYPSTYTITEGDCTDSVVLTLVVVEDEVVCDLDLGEDVSFSVTLSQAEAIPSEDELRKLYSTNLDSSVPTNGTFSPSIEQIVYQFNSGEKIGSYTTTYTVTNSNDCSDSVQITLNVVPDPVTCNISAGNDNVRVMTLSEAKALPSIDEVKKVYLNMLDAGVSRNGSFDPSIRTLVEMFNRPGEMTGDYTTTYTVKDGECTDSTSLTLRVIAD